MPTEHERTAPAASLQQKQVKPPFVIGVTGTMSLLGYNPVKLDLGSETAEIQSIRRKIRSILDWIQATDGCLDPETGKFHAEKGNHGQSVEVSRDGKTHQFHPWKALGLEHTPIVVLSSLAPGIDTLVAEEAMMYAKDKKVNVTVRCPLPFTPDEYANVSTFADPANKQRYQKLLEALRSQPSWDEQRDLFGVCLDEDWLEDGRGSYMALIEENKKKSSRLHYRAAGEYVAAYSDLLLAMYDTAIDDPKADVDNLWSCGASTVALAKQRGLTWELLSVSNNFAWADNGPVLHIPVEKQLDDRQESYQDAPMEFRHPIDCRPSMCEENCPNSDPQWQENGDHTFRRILSLQNQFNAPDNISAEGESSEIYKLLLSTNERTNKDRTDKTPDEQRGLVRDNIGDDGLRHADRLDAIARVRARASKLSADLDTCQKKLLIWLILLIGVAAVCLGAFEHWHTQAEEASHGSHHGHAASVIVHETGGIVQCCFLLTTLVCLVISGRLYYKHLRSKNEAKRYDARAISEGLRVQFYWSLAGLTKSVAANYMQRQRNELDWIRYVASSLGSPYHIWKESFGKLETSSRLAVLKRVQSRWLGGQHSYFQSKVKEVEHKIHFWHIVAWSFAAAGLIQVIAMLVLEVSPLFAAHGKGPMCCIAAVFCALSLSTVVPFLWLPIKRVAIGTAKKLSDNKSWYSNIQWLNALAKKKKPQFQPHHSEQHEMPAFCRWLFTQKEVWASALFISSFVFVLPYLLPDISHDFPNKDNWWIILTGASLLTGALSLAWSERNFYAEIFRNYSAMHDLFGCASRRMQHLLSKLETETDWSTPTNQRTLAEINDLLYRVGCEALDENAEWLIQHRARPLEPFMAG